LAYALSGTSAVASSVTVTARIPGLAADDTPVGESRNGHTGQRVAQQRHQPGVSVGSMAYPMTAAAARLGELAAEARDTHRPVTIGEHGQLVAAIIGIEDLADLQDGAALAAHLAGKADGGGGVPLGDLDAALDKIDARA
jgi:prevent-host-death family protein